MAQPAAGHSASSANTSSKTCRQADSLTAVQLLSDAGSLRRHKYAIDALIAAMALRPPAPVLVLTSDHDDWSKLCGDRIQGRLTSKSIC